MNTSTLKNACFVTIFILLNLSYSFSQCIPVTVDDDPEDVTVTEGNSASLTVTVDGTPPISYFWYKDGEF